MYVGTVCLGILVPVIVFGTSYSFWLVVYCQGGSRLRHGCSPTPPIRSRSCSPRSRSPRSRSPHSHSPRSHSCDRRSQVSYYYLILFFNPSLVLYICVFLLSLFLSHRYYFSSLIYILFCPPLPPSLHTPLPNFISLLIFTPLLLCVIGIATTIGIATVIEIAIITAAEGNHQ